MAAASVVVCGAPPPGLLAPARVCGGAFLDVSCVLPTATYDVGMRTRAAVRRQLDADVPRSVVRVRGRPAETARDVEAGTPLARLCTQGVLAPPVEWLLAAGLVAHELPNGDATPMTVDVARDGAVTVHKCLGLRAWRDVDRSCGTLELRVDADERHVVVALALHPVDEAQTGVAAGAQSTAVATT